MGDSPALILHFPRSGVSLEEGIIKHGLFKIAKGTTSSSSVIGNKDKCKGEAKTRNQKYEGQKEYEINGGNGRHNLIKEVAVVHNDKDRGCVENMREQDKGTTTAITIFTHKNGNHGHDIIEHKKDQTRDNRKGKDEQRGQEKENTIKGLEEKGEEARKRVRIVPKSKMMPLMEIN
ncbi:hypothetical protein ACH5RR_017633 [Cinchona calisaya]|uniref:Uncharacterized protein n=1 Tax=Cinchona calisaya TaxID=153742 RepID=A0ABD2ZK28_9GENT